MVDQDRYDYPTVIAGLVGLWLNSRKTQLLAQGKDYANEFHQKLALAKNSIREAIEADAELNLELNGMRLCFQRTSQGFVLEMCFLDELSARIFYKLISVFKLFQRDEIPAEFEDDLNMLVAMLLNEAPMLIKGARIVIELPRERKFFAEAQPYLHQPAERPHAPV